NPVAWGMISLFAGVAAVAIAQITEYYPAAVILGGGGMLIGGFSISISSHFTTKEKYQYMWFAIAGIMASVIGFMLGFMNWFG
ncbi:MAG: hypothetical protein FWG60_01835, partial [Methanomassiliicoccaceae archaeon]|nr:hypothetical protein [Methanomassiliicoccaceae archaeon]